MAKKPAEPAAAEPSKSTALTVLNDNNFMIVMVFPELC